MALNWNEIKDRAVRFSKEWEGTTSEDAEAKSFLDAFFEVFGISRKKIGTFEHRSKSWMMVMADDLLQSIFSKFCIGK